MYNSKEIAERIKMFAKQSGISVKDMLSDLQLASNTLQNMKTSMIKADSLARIADYLNVSVDYLLGRLPQSMPPETFTEARTESEWTDMLSVLDDDDLLKVKSYVEFLVSQKSDSAKK